MTRRHHPEQQLQKAVLEHLAWRGVPGLFWFHVPNGGYRTAIEAAIFKSLGLIAGVPDLLLVHDGRLYALELKVRGGRLSPTQAEVQERMRQASAIVAVATGIDEALAYLELWQLIRRNVAERVAS
jgi:hypothetical protein